MAVNKNFVVKNGLEVNETLILADVNTQRVGIGSTTPRYTLDVVGGIGATHTYVVGVSTVITDLRVGTSGTIFSVLGVEGAVGVGTTNPVYLLDIRSPVSTGQTALYVQGDVRVTGDLNVDDITFDDATVQNLTITDTLYLGGESGLSTFVGFADFKESVAIQTDFYVGGISTFTNYVNLNDNLNVVGLTTLANVVDINSTLDVSNTLNVGGATTLGGYVDINNSVDISDNLNVVGISTFVGLSTFVDSVFVQDNLQVAGLSTFIGIGSFKNDLYVSGNLIIQQDVNLDTNLYLVGIATIGQLGVLGLSTTRFLEVTGVSTFVGYVDINDSVDISDNLNVVGLTTLGGYVDINDSVDISDNLNVVGLTTLGGYVDINDSVDISNNLNVTGISTFVGIGSFLNDLYVTGDSVFVGNVDLDTNLFVAGIATIGTLNVSGLTTTTDLEVFGLSTFVGFSTFNDYVNIQGGLVNAGVTTSNAYTIDGTQVISSARELQNIASLDAVTTATIESAISNAPNTFTDIKVTGVSTFIGIATFNSGVEVVSGVTTLGGYVDINNSVDISGSLNVGGISTFVGFSTFQDDVYVAGVVTATEFHGDGSNLTGNASGLNAAIGVGSEGVFIGAGVTQLNFNSTNGTSITVDAATAGIATVTITPGVSLGLAIALGG